MHSIHTFAYNVWFSVLPIRPGIPFNSTHWHTHAWGGGCSQAHHFTPDTPNTTPTHTLNSHYALLAMCVGVCVCLFVYHILYKRNNVIRLSYNIRSREVCIIPESRKLNTKCMRAELRVCVCDSCVCIRLCGYSKNKHQLICLSSQRALLPVCACQHCTRHSTRLYYANYSTGRIWNGEFCAPVLYINSAQLGENPGVFRAQDTCTHHTLTLMLLLLPNVARWWRASVCEDNGTKRWE